jgi:hypothetical protein
MSAVSPAKFLYGMSSSLLAAASSRAELPAARHRGCAVADPQVTRVLSGFMTWPGSIARRGESRVAERRRRVPPLPSRHPDAGPTNPREARTISLRSADNPVVKHKTTNPSVNSPFINERVRSVDE